MSYIKVAAIWCLLIVSSLAFQVPANRSSDETAYLVHLDGDSSPQDIEKAAGGSFTILDQDAKRNLYLLSGNPASLAKIESAVPGARIERATQVLVELDSQVDISNQVEALGGLAKPKFQNISVQAVAIPISKLRALLAIPGVKSIRKEKSYRPSAKRQ